MYLRLFLLFLKLGFLSIGGGYPMMSLIYEQGSAAVGLTSAQFADMTALELLASGPIAINGATYIGYIKGGFGGSVIATLGVCIPPFILTTIVYFFLSRFQKSQYIQGFLSAIKVACGGILITTACILGQNIFFSDKGIRDIIQFPFQNVQWFGLLIFALCLTALYKFKANPIHIILGAGLLGALFFR